MTSIASKIEPQPRHPDDEGPMFDFGKSYYITMWVRDGDGSRAEQRLAGEATAIAMPLVRFKSLSGEEAIINTNSIAFVGAKLAEE